MTHVPKEQASTPSTRESADERANSMTVEPERIPSPQRAATGETPIVAPQVPPQVTQAETKPADAREPSQETRAIVPRVTSPLDVFRAPTSRSEADSGGDAAPEA